MVSKWRKIVAAIKSAAHDYHFSHPIETYPDDCNSCMNAAYRNLETELQQRLTNQHFKWLLRRQIAVYRERQQTDA